MSIKTQRYPATKKGHPAIGILLFVISIILLIITAPLGFIFGLCKSILKKGIGGLSTYLLQIAISIDQLGNVLMAQLLNTIWINKMGYKFGNRDETISSALGRNKQLNTLNSFGRFIDAILDRIDPNHSLNSIDYYVEPSEQIIDKIAWIHLVDGKLLSTRSKGRSCFYIPGGKREDGETDAETLSREIKEELSVQIQLSSLQFMGVFEAQADHHKKGILVRMRCYKANYIGDLNPNSEIEEMVWLNYSDKEKVSEVDKIIFDFLKEKGELN